MKHRQPRAGVRVLLLGAACAFLAIGAAGCTANDAGNGEPADITQWPEASDTWVADRQADLASAGLEIIGSGGGGGGEPAQAGKIGAFAVTADGHDRAALYAACDGDDDVAVTFETADGQSAKLACAGDAAPERVLDAVGVPSSGNFSATVTADGVTSNWAGFFIAE